MDSNGDEAREFRIQEAAEEFECEMRGVAFKLMWDIIICMIDREGIREQIMNEIMRATIKDIRAQVSLMSEHMGPDGIEVLTEDSDKAISMAVKSFKDAFGSCCLTEEFSSKIRAARGKK